MRSFQTESDRAAAEYLTAFIKLLYSRGKSAYEIEDKLEIDSDLIWKLIPDPKFKAELEKRNLEYIEELKKDPHPLDKDRKLREHRLYEYQGKWHKRSNYLKNVGPWQRQRNFQNAIDYHIGKKKRYTGNDIDVLLKLSPAASARIREENPDLSVRNLSADHKLRIINFIADGHGIKELSEKFNCSELAVKQTLEEREIAFPVTDATIERRIRHAIEGGYSFEQLTSRFKNTNPEGIKELIKEMRIDPVMDDISSQQAGQ
jgi:hypothetical protein